MLFNNLGPTFKNNILIKKISKFKCCEYKWLCHCLNKPHPLHSPLSIGSAPPPYTLPHQKKNPLYQRNSSPYTLPLAQEEQLPYTSHSPLHPPLRTWWAPPQAKESLNEPLPLMLKFFSPQTMWPPPHTYTSPTHLLSNIWQSKQHISE